MTYKLMSEQLKPPTFIKVSAIGPAKHCYTVYATIVEAKPAQRETRAGPIKGVEGVLADETGAANFRFIGEQFVWVEQGKTIAIRNGLSNVVDEHILLEVDKFGRVTEEKEVKIEKPNTQHNISATPYVKKPQAAKKGTR
jgi:ssDNA-binding replication factor A large subunit